MINEEWKDIKDLDGLYQISNFGNVINIQRNTKLSQCSNHTGHGYMFVDLYKNHKRKRIYVHRLVALHFIDNPLNKPYINHKDGNPRNNYFENLDWCTALENVTHASNVLGVMKAYKNHNLSVMRKVRQIDYATGKTIAEYPSINEAKRVTGIPASHITNICKHNEHHKSIHGFSWCYIEDTRDLNL